MINKTLFTLLTCCMSLLALSQNIGINATGASPDAKAMLDIVSTSSGLLIPRMTTEQRDAITSPPNGLQIYNITTNTQDIYRGTQWESTASINPGSNLVYVYSLANLPAPAGDAITLDSTKMYVFSGFVDISPNYLNLNGAGLRGTDPGKDGVMSAVAGGVLRSTDVSVFIENFAVIPSGASTKAYDFSDATGTKYCNLFSGCSVVEIGIPSLGVGQVSGFKATTIIKNFWSCADGIKVTGTVDKFASAYNFITGIANGGAGIEFLSGLDINDIDLSNNYFIYTGQTGVKVNGGAAIDRGRMTTNMFRGVTTFITGFDSYTPEWEMRQNTNIPNTRAFGALYMSGPLQTSLTVQGTFYKIQGATTPINQKRFTASDNRLTYTGKDIITGKILVTMGAKAPSNNSDFSIAIAKNGIVIPIPNGSMGSTTNNQSFQITLASEVDLVNKDYIEVFIRRNSSDTSITVEELQFRVTD